MVYLKIFSNHTSYEANEDDLAMPCVVWDNEHIHFVDEEPTSKAEIIEDNLDPTNYHINEELY